jgi:hypothetical protein
MVDGTTPTGMTNVTIGTVWAGTRSPRASRSRRPGGAVRRRKVIILLTRLNTANRFTNNLPRSTPHRGGWLFRAAKVKCSPCG